MRGYLVAMEYNNWKKDDSESFDFYNNSQAAYSEIVDALSRDMPLILHGSGDVPVWDVNPRSSRILAQLTASYIGNLVEAAVESQEILNDGERPPLPPPPLVSKETRRRAPLPSAYEWPPSVLARSAKAAATAASTTSKKKKKSTKGEPSSMTATAATTAATATSAASSKDATGTKDGNAATKKMATEKKNNPAVNKPNFGEKKKRKRRDIVYWDEPLPEPKLKNKPAASESTEGIIYKGVPIGDWVGVAGVDFYEDNRIRNAHVALPAVLGAQNFIFPVCHDKHLYGKILEIQATRRSMEPILMDSVVMDVIRAETASLQGPLGKKRRDRDKKQKKSEADAGGETDDDEADGTDSDNDEYSGRQRPIWPGLDELLPMHTTLDF